MASRSRPPPSKASGRFAPWCSSWSTAPRSPTELQGGPIPLHEALQIARQVADALATAHDQGIIHRDLKPANVKLRTDGTVKILDFGLAKALEPAGDPSSPAPADPANSPTLTAASQMGVVMGTAAYLSPEQARGENASKRSDIWAFGVVLLEMLTGKHPFRGPTVPETLALVLTKEPDWSILPPDTPPSIRRLLRRCLEKEPKRRLGYIGDAQLDLDEAEDELGALGSSEATTTWQRRVPTLLAAAIVSLVIGMAISNLLSPTSIVRPLTRFRLSMPEDMQFSSVGVSLSVAPDGGAVALAMSSTQIRVPVGPQHPSGFPNPARYPRMTYLFPQDQLDPHPLPGAAGANSLSFSPDGQWLLIDGGVGTLAKVPISGGRPITLHEGPIRGASWGADDTIVFGQAGKGLWRISAAGTGLEQLTHVEADESHVYPHFLSGESAALFGVWRGGMETARIDVLSLESGERRTLVEGVTPRYSATGHLLFGRDAALWAAPFDLHRLEVTGSPVQVLSDLHINTTAGAFGSAQYAVADDGSLVYAPRRLTPVETRTLVWVDRDGHEEPLAAEPRRYRYTRIAPDGTRVAVHAQDQESDIWTWDFARETLTRLTFDPFHDTGPVWTPDGERVAFRRAPRNQGPGSPRVFWKASHGTGSAELLVEGPLDLMPTAFAPDGQRLLLTGYGPDADLYQLLLGHEPVVELLIGTEFNERNAEISPDGRWVAYQSDASGQYEIYVQPFPNLNSARWQLSSNGGTHPLWSHEGGELFHWTLDRNLVSVSVQTDPTFVPGDSQVIIEALGNEYLVLPPTHLEATTSIRTGNASCWSSWERAPSQRSSSSKTGIRSCSSGSRSRSG